MFADASSSGKNSLTCKNDPMLTIYYLKANSCVVHYKQSTNVVFARKATISEYLCCFAWVDALKINQNQVLAFLPMKSGTTTEGRKQMFLKKLLMRRCMLNMIAEWNQVYWPRSQTT